MAQAAVASNKNIGSECTEDSQFSGEREYSDTSDSQDEIEDFQEHLEDPF